MNENPFIVSRDWLEERLHAPGMAILDASWYLPAQGRDAKAEYDAAHIPGAVFFDHDVVVEPGSTLPHTLPSPTHFAQFAGAMGVAADDTIVVYDGPGLFTAPRAWWIFRVMGAQKVFLLDGGFDRWKAEGRPVTAEPTKIAPNLFKVNFDASRVVGFDEMRRIVEEGGAQVVDVRARGRFEGSEPEPRAGMRSGHMPNAINLPFAQLAENGSLLPPNGLRNVLEEAGVDLSRPVVSSCGSGVTAAVLNLALEVLGHEDHRLYDGSWSEWGRRPDTEVETGRGS
ncbi:MAG TPA: 3-mercaptopyruvate sulfurtransferase [Mesorhizobium sp.]|nr:3-mercaptopyruvate sulfurtransferase [Mesorhizobium sp.]